VTDEDTQHEHIVWHRRGRPRVFFCLRARSKPIAIRSLIRFRSSSATAVSKGS